MRELSILDLNVVGGGDYSVGDMMAIGTGLGGGIGLSLAATFNLSAANALIVAGIGSAAGAGFTAAALAGWAVGQGLNDHTPIQDWIAGKLDAFNAATNARNNQTLDGDE
jgi:hypothetical protein